MRETSQKTQNMLASSIQFNPGAMLKVDIDPPFVGVNFGRAGSDPSLLVYAGRNYLTFIDDDCIKINIVDIDDIGNIKTFGDRITSSTVSNHLSVSSNYEINSAMEIDSTSNINVLLNILFGGLSLRVIPIAGVATRSRLAFELYPGHDDLPLIVFTNPIDGKVYAYSEQYNEDFNTTSAIDEIGSG